MIERWYWLTLIVIFCWALGSFFGKIALIKDIPYRVYLFEGLGAFCVVIFFLFFKRAEIFTGFSFNIPGLLMGLSWGFGTVLFIVALQSGKLSIIVPLTALYPAVTVLLSIFFLKESLESREIIGIIFAILSGVLLAK